MSNEAAIALRNRLAAFVEAREEAMPTREIVAAFRAAHGPAVDAAASMLFDVGLTKLVADVSARRKAGDASQGDLFRGASMPHAIVVDVFEGGRKKRARKPFTSATVAEVNAYLTRTLPDRKPRRDKGVQAILDRVRPFITSPSQTIAEALAAADAADAAAAAERSA